MCSECYLGEKKVSLIVRCPDFSGCNLHKQGAWDSQMCPVYRDTMHIHVHVHVHMYSRVHVYPE